MAVFRAIVFSAVLAGLLVGGFVTGLQRLGTVPLIMKAEAFETHPAPAAHVHADGAAPHTHGEAAAPHTHDAAWEPSEGLERTAYTALFNVVDWIGFGLLLTGGFVLARRPVGWREGLLWGLAGYVCLVIAPGIGLPPELPGTAAAPLLARQAWWIGTAASTATGLALVAFGRSPWLAVLGVLAIAAPHVVGAPLPDTFEASAPEALARQFVTAATLTALPAWALLGGLSGHLYRRMGLAA